MAEDISRKAVLILVAIAIVVSVLSTSLVLNAVYDAPNNGGNVVEAGAPMGAATATLSVPPQPAAASATLTVTNPDN